MKGSNMQVVYFPEDLSARAPEVMGCLCATPGNEWVTLLDVVAAIQRREVVTVRPASESEMKRAEAYVALYEIGAMIGEKMNTLLDQAEPNVAVGVITEMCDELERLDQGPVELLDREKGA
jgi:hypothetical protein